MLVDVHWQRCRKKEGGRGKIVEVEVTTLVLNKIPEPNTFLLPTKLMFISFFKWHNLKMWNYNLCDILLRFERTI